MGIKVQIDRIAKTVYEKQRANYKLNEAVNELACEVQTFTDEIQLVIERNLILKREIDSFIATDDLVAECLKQRSAGQYLMAGEMMSPLRSRATKSDY